ncbi:zinc finger, CCHC-type containing protein [Tanacetum coccineum]
MASMNTRLNIEKLDGNIVQKHGGSKQVGFKQLGPGVKTGVHGVHDEKRVWFEVELQGAQGDREAEVFQVSNDDTAVAQRWLEDKQPEEKTNTDCLVKEQEKEYQTGWKIKTGNVLDSCNQRSTQQCMKSGVTKHLGVAGIQQQNRFEDTTKSTYLVNKSPSSSIEFKKPIDMLGFFGWLASIKQGMLEPVKVKCIFLGYYKSIVRNKLWREDSNKAAFTVAAVEKIYAHESLTFNNTVACEVISKWKAGLKDDMDVRSDVCKAEIWATKGLLDKAKGNILGLEIIRDQSGNTLRVSQSRIHNEKLVLTLLKGQSTLSLKDSLSEDCDVEKNDKWPGVSGGSLKANLQHMEALSTTEARYMTFTEARKKEIWLKGLLTELGYELRLVAGIATGALVKGCSRSEVPAQVKTYDRKSIEEILEREDGKCVKTGMLIVKKACTKDHTSKKLISRWCKDHNYPQHRTNLDSSPTRDKHMKYSLSHPFNSDPFLDKHHQEYSSYRQHLEMETGDQGEFVETIWKEDHIFGRLGYPAWSTIDTIIEFNLLYVYIPVNIKDSHWFLGKLDMQGWTLTMYDSLQGFTRNDDDLLDEFGRCLPRLLSNIDYFQQLGQQHAKMNLTRQPAYNVPQQMGHGDCGVLVCFFMTKLIRGESLELETSAQDAAKKFRRVMESELSKTLVIR